MKKEAGRDVVRCPRCGEEYSVSYRRCPFCEEDDNPRRVKAKQHGGHRVTERKKTYSGRGALIVILLLVLALLTWVLFGESLLARFAKPEETPVEDTVPPERSGDVDPFYDPSIGEDAQTPPDVTDPDAVTPPGVDAPEISDANADVSNAKLSNEDFTLYVGESVQLRVTGTDAAAAWSSKDSTVAVVGSSGLVTAVNPGTTTITATVGDRVLEGIARVKSGSGASDTGASEVKLNREDITLGVGESFQLKVTGTDAGVTWSIENSDYASISASGVVKGLKSRPEGVKAYAKVNGKTLSCVVRIK